jgi:competence protein ComEA
LLNVVDSSSKPPIIIRDPLPDATIVVYIEGAVASPAAYALPGTARIQDAVEAAGGFHDKADNSALNLAARLRDEDRVFVPFVQEAESLPNMEGVQTETQDFDGEQEADPARDQPLNINTATEEQLEVLPGIGPSLAAAISESRRLEGRFTSVDDLERVKGISARMVDEIRSMITV